MKFPSNITGKLRSALALALILWCAGTGCILVSYANSTAIGGTGSSPAQIEDLASSNSNSSCHAQHASQKQNDPTQKGTNATSEKSTGSEQITLPENRDPFGSMSCCPLAVGKFVVASRAHSDEANTATPALGELSSLSLKDFDLAPHVYPPRLPDQDRTYLRCCVFLI